MNKNLKFIFIFVIILAFLFGIFYVIKNKKENSAPRLISSSQDNTSSVAENTLVNNDTNFLNTLEYIKSMQIDASLFINSAFKSLENNTVTIDSDRTVGRPNPFSPIPGSQQVILDILQEPKNLSEQNKDVNNSQKDNLNI